jgi:hypothetical protein
VKTKRGNLDSRTTVGLLTRDIRIWGTDVDNWGCRLLVTKYGTDVIRVGRVDLQAVSIKYGGKFGTSMAALDFRNILKNTQEN